MIDKNKLIDELNNSTILLMESLSEVSAEDFNKRIEPGSWSVGDICEHILKLETTVNNLILNADGKGRDPGEKIEIIKNRFEDNETKFKAGGPISASENPKDKDEIMKQIGDCRNKLVSIINECDIDRECLGFEHGIFGYLTGLEWVYFNIYHTNRHAQQIFARQANFIAQKY